MPRSKRGEIWISVVIYVLIVVVVMLLILEAGLPILNNARDRSSYAKMKETMQTLDQQITDIANEGQGSQRVIHLDVPKGDVEVSDNKLIWKMETGTKVLEPRTRVDQGSLVIASDLDVTATEYATSYIIQNSRILLNVTKFGSSTNWTAIDTSSLINYTEFKDTGARTGGKFKFVVQKSENSTTGNGYTSLKETGTKLTTAVVTSHVNNSNYEYDLKISLDSKADFFRATIENFREK